jgi:hypothetical protein
MEVPFKKETKGTLNLVGLVRFYEVMKQGGICWRRWKGKCVQIFQVFQFLLLVGIIDD